MSRELAQRLAGEAARIAVTLEALAAVHESLAGLADHPLSAGAAERAAAQRHLAARERASSAWHASISDGSSGTTPRCFSGCRPSRRPGGRNRRPPVSR